MSAADILNGLSGMAWSDAALCAEIGGDEWFTDDEWSHSPSKAKKVCGRCPIQVECLEFALDHNEPYGIWGGLTHGERRQLKRERRLAS